MRCSVLIATVLTLLAGCAIVPVTPAASLPLATEITQFAFNGRLAVRQNETSHHLNIDWRHTPDNDEILLTTPFGQGVAELSRDASGARLILADQRSLAANDWNALAREVFGIPLPLDRVHRWLIGDLSDTRGWRIEILERENQEGLPSLLELERDDIKVRLKIDAWQEAR